MSTAADVADNGRRRVPRWLWVSLVASLAVNVLLIGLIAGASWFRHRSGGPLAYAAGHFGFVRTLPKERRDMLRQAEREQLAGLRPLWQAVREARREADRVLAVEPFDAKAFLAAHRLLLDKENEARRAGTQILADTAARLTPDERRQMAGWRDRQRGRWRDQGPSGDTPGAPGAAGRTP